MDTLEPIRLFTIEFQHALGTTGIVLPAVEMVYKQLNEVDVDPNSLPQLLSSLVRKRFSIIYQDVFMQIANCLDPRFANKALENGEFCQKVKHCLNIVTSNQEKYMSPSEELTISIDKLKVCFPRSLRLFI